MSRKNRITVYCETCGKPKIIIMALYLRNKSKKFYCDMICFSKKETVHCSQCGKEKLIKRGEFKEGKNYFCDKECHDKYQRGGIDNYIVKCESCGIEKTITPYEFNKYKSHFCDKKCFDEWQIKSEYSKGINNPRYNRIIKKCDNVDCGKDIEISPYQICDNNFCCNECYGKWRSINIIGDKHPCYKGGKVKVECCICKEDAGVRDQWEIEDKRLFVCSDKCRNKMMSLLNSGDGNPAWNGGYYISEYDYEFNENLKETVRERDGRKCQLCGITEEENQQALAAHHIDYIKTNSFESNLISLGQKCGCHQKTNHNREYWTNYFQELMKEKYNYQLK